MNTNDDAFAATFFDEPGLLAVRFTGAKKNRVANFAAYRRPDVAPAELNINGGCVVGIGIALVCVGIPFFAFQTSSAHTSYSDSGPTAVFAPSSDQQQVEASSSVDLSNLADELAPLRRDLQPWLVRTLLDVPREQQRHGDSTEGWIQPRFYSEGQAAFRRGQQLASMLKTAGAGVELAVILDLPGPMSVATAAGMASSFDPVFTMDNLPHAAGVVPSGQTLSAIVAWRSTFMAARSARTQPVPALFILEGNRLNIYQNEVERFDNRSLARLPEPTEFKALGVKRILYVREHRGAVGEADDLNAFFAALASADMEVRHLAIETMDDVSAEKIAGEQLPEAASPATPVSAQQTNDHVHSMWFWRHYGWYGPIGRSWSEPQDEDARYRTALRQTPFSFRNSSTLFDGGEHQHTSALNSIRQPRRVSPPVVSSQQTSHQTSHSSFQTSPSHTTTTSSGGSWSRSFSSSSG